MDEHSPIDPLDGMIGAAVAMHELFLQYQEAGFTEGQAFELVRTAVAAMFGTMRP